MNKKMRRIHFVSYCIVVYFHPLSSYVCVYVCSSAWVDGVFFLSIMVNL